MDLNPVMNGKTIINNDTLLKKIIFKLAKVKTEIEKKVLKKVLPDYTVEEWQKVRAKNQSLKKGAEKAEKIIQHQQEVLLEIGSGDKKGINGWTTLDICGKCDIYWDLLLPFPLPDNSVTKIYSSHVLEHFYYRDIKRLLAECHRILKPNGVFSVCVPDASIYINAYLSEEEFKPKDVYNPAFCINTRIDFINYMAYMDGHHRYLFDRENLLAILKKVGFKGVRTRKFDPEIDMAERDWESIYAEGNK